MPPVFARKNSLLWFCVSLADLGNYLIVNYHYRCNILYDITRFCTNMLQYNTELHIFIIGLVVVYLLFGRILVNFSQNQNGEWCYPALQHFGWSETSLLQVWYVISTHCVVLLGVIIFVLVKIKLFQSYVFHFNHSCSLGCDSTRNWYNNRALPI